MMNRPQPIYEATAIPRVASSVIVLCTALLGAYGIELSSAVLDALLYLLSAVLAFSVYRWNYNGARNGHLLVTPLSDPVDHQGNRLVAEVL